MVIVEDPTNDALHKWAKVTGRMSVIHSGVVCDIMICEKCGITGKRIGLTPRVIIDSKYHKKVFRRCDTTMEYKRSGEYQNYFNNKEEKVASNYKIKYRKE